MTGQQFSLRWNNYLRHVTNAFDMLRCQDDLVDVTLCCEGKKIRAHKMLLSACSTYFKEIFIENPCPHPVIIFRNVMYDDLCAIINFMYNGEVNISQDQLSSFLTTAELLEVQGLTAGSDKDIECANELEIVRETSLVTETNTPETYGHSKRRKLYLKRRGDIDTDVSQRPSPPRSTISATEVMTNNRFKVETIDNLEECTVNNADMPGPSIISFPEEIEICESETYQVDDSNILNELKSPEVIFTNSEPTTGLGVDSLPKDNIQGVIDWNALLCVESDIPGKSVTLSAAVAPKKELVKVQCDRKLTYTNIDFKLKNSTCHICDKEFLHPNSLSHHKKSHQTETQCSICNKYYTRAYDLKRHIRTSHSVTDESDKSS